MPLLSICIPSIRGKEVRELLASVLVQKQPLDYELILQDNASEGVGESFRATYVAGLPWTYRRNPSNIGGYNNVWQCTVGARGKYLLILSDDDQLVPEAFGMLGEIIAELEAGQRPTALLYDRFKLPSGRRVASVPDSFRWLRWAPINIAAFVSFVVWRTDYWREIKYRDLEPYFSLPQLHAFVQACAAGPGVLSNYRLVDIGAAEPTNVPRFWFYTKNPPLDVLEYPYLYTQVLESSRLDLLTRLIVLARRIKHRRLGLEKLIFIAVNNDYYKISPELVARCDYGTGDAWFARLAARFMLRTRIGHRIARRTVKKNARIPASVQKYDDNRQF